MSPLLTELAERPRLVEHEFDGEPIEQALDTAFDRIDIDTLAQIDTFQEVVDMDALSSLHDGSAGTPVCTVFVLYGYPVAVTSDAVRIYGTAESE